MKISRHFLILFTLVASPLVAVAEMPLAVEVGAGTAGLGLQLHAGISERLNVRLGYNHLSASQDVDAEDNNGVPNDELRYSGDLKLNHFSALADFYPWAGRFFVSGGGVLNNNDIKVEARCNNPSGCEVGNSSFSRTEIGTITTDIEVKDFGPYLGFGWGNPVAGDVGLHWRFEVGAVYLGSPSVSMSSDGSCTSLLTPCQNKLNEEEEELEDDLSSLEWYPVVQLGLSYRFR